MTGNTLPTVNKYQTGPIKHFLKQLSMLARFKTKRESRFNELTDREVEVLSLVARGMNNPDIVGELGITRATVQNHRASIREKLGITHEADYIKYALAYELIQF